MLSQSTSLPGLSFNLGIYHPAVETALERLLQDQVISRIWRHDHTIWKPEPTEISNRLGWLHIMPKMKQDLPILQAFADHLRQEGYTHALLLGMGGSSLAPGVLRKTFGVLPGYLNLQVLDSTDPGAVLSYADRLDPSKTLFIVSTKSGETVETLSLLKFFYNLVARRLGVELAGSHFIAITDPGSQLAKTADQHQFRETFLNDPDIGGRYSALSYFGLAPAALTGMDLETLLDRAIDMARRCRGEDTQEIIKNPGALLGATLGQLALLGRDKVTFLSSPAIGAFGDWLEQLIAESTGKQGKGILPVNGDVIGEAKAYRPDRVFIHFSMQEDDASFGAIHALEDTGHPVIHQVLKDKHDLGGQFFLWEMATAVAGYILGINPFDQPDVEAAKVLARKMVATYQEKGCLPQPSPSLQFQQIAVFCDFPTNTLEEALSIFLSQAREGAYIALQAYIQPTGETDDALYAFRSRLREVTRLAVTSGYGPRYLHSTGQLHKGDAGLGLFIQVTAANPKDAPIPSFAGENHSMISFGVLEMAQALGDFQALMEAGRKVIRFHFDLDVIAGLSQLNQALG